jgi:hypothetical protein
VTLPNVSIAKKYPILLLPVRLETRLIDHRLYIRIYPDQLAVEDHQPVLTKEECNARESFRKQYDSAQTTIEKRAAWRIIAQQFGSPRAAWIVNAPEPSPDQLSSEPSSRSRVRTLPDYFVIQVYIDGKLQYSQRGNNISQELPLISDLNRDDDRSELFDQESRWMTNFSEAETRGMAVTIDLADDLSVSTITRITRIIAVGVKHTDCTDHDEAARDGKTLLEDLITNHRYSSGIGFLEWGTPTNNTQEARSGHSDLQDNYEQSYDIVFGNLPKKPSLFSNAGQLGCALGLSAELNVLRDAERAFEHEALYIADLQEALWPATGDYFLSHLLPPGLIGKPYRKELWMHFRSAIRARGALPTLRAGNLPYGVLPVTGIRDWHAGNSYDYEQGLYAVLLRLFEMWLTLANDNKRVSRVGASETDPDDELLKILSMEPASTSYRVRRFVDDKFWSWTLASQLDDWLKILAGTGQPLKPKDLTTQWLGGLTGMQGRVRSLLESFRINQAMALEAPLLKLLAWREGLPFTEPLVIDPASQNGNPKVYLETLSSQGTNAAADTAKTLLFELLFRSLLVVTPRSWTLKSRSLRDN